MTQTRDIFAEKMIAKLVNCGTRYNQLRQVLNAVYEDVMGGDSILEPTLLQQVEQVLGANPVVYMDGVQVLEAVCPECKASDPIAFGHWDTCSQNRKEP